MSFICGHLNVRSLTGHFDAIVSLIRENTFNLFCISESWLTDGVSNQEIAIDGYNIERCDRQGRGGGVAIYIKNNINYRVVKIGGDIEQLWLVINLTRMSIAFSVAYRSQTVNCEFFWNAFENSLSEVISSVDKVFCLGDFNTDLLDISSTQARYVQNAFDSFGMTQLVDVPTRITEVSESLLDYVLVSDVDCVSEIRVAPVTDVADHEIIICTLNLQVRKSKPVYKTFRDFRGFNCDQFNSALNSIPWRVIYDTPEVNEKVAFLTDAVKSLFDMYAPMVTIRVTKPHAPWLTKHLRKMIIDRDKLLLKYKRTKNLADWNVYKRFRNIVNSAVKTDKKTYFSRLLSINQPDIWKALHKLNSDTKQNHTLPSHLADAELLNSCFLNSVPDLNVDASLIGSYETKNMPGISDKFSFKPVTEMDVLKLIGLIKSKASGADGLNIDMIRLCIPTLLPYLAHIVNFCLLHSVFPDVWKKARVIPLPKKQNVNDFSDLRPVSILPILSKILEKIMQVQFQEHLSKNKIISPYQSGFRSGHSCETALLKITDDIIDAWDKGKLTCLVLLDYSRAFDTLNHDLLISKLRYVGLSEDSVNLFSSYLRNRFQAVEYEGRLSGWLPINRGVPQGSMLSPLLYNTYVFDLHSINLSCSRHLYADDTQYYLSFTPEEGRQAVSAINFDLELLTNYSKGHCLELNPNKSVGIVFGKEKSREKFKRDFSSQIVLKNKAIKVESCVKNLGLFMDQELRFTTHVNRCLQRCYARLRQLYPYRHFLNRNMKKLLCNTLVLAQLDYCDSVYGPCLTHVDRLRVQRVQNSCLRYIFGIRKFERVSYTLKMINWLNMQGRRLFHTLCLFDSIVKYKAPQYLYKKLTFRTDVHVLNLRFRGRLTPPIHHTQLYKRSFSYCISKLYNDLPENLKSRSQRSFRKNLRRHLSDGLFSQGYAC